MEILLCLRKHHLKTNHSIQIQTQQPLSFINLINKSFLMNYSAGTCCSQFHTDETTAHECQDGWYKLLSQKIAHMVDGRKLHECTLSFVLVLKAEE